MVCSELNYRLLETPLRRRGRELPGRCSRGERVLPGVTMPGGRPLSDRPDVPIITIHYTRVAVITFTHFTLRSKHGGASRY